MAKRIIPLLSSPPLSPSCLGFPTTKRKWKWNQPFLGGFVVCVDGILWDGRKVVLFGFRFLPVGLSLSVSLSLCCCDGCVFLSFVWSFYYWLPVARRSYLWCGAPAAAHITTTTTKSSGFFLRPSVDTARSGSCFVVGPNTYGRYDVRACVDMSSYVCVRTG